MRQPCAPPARYVRRRRKGRLPSGGPARCLLVALSALVLAAAQACGGAFGPPVPEAVRPVDAGDLAAATSSAGDAGMIYVPALDWAQLLFDWNARTEADDPALPMCGPEGTEKETATNEQLDREADAGLQLGCPSDKNLPGCPCDEVGKEAACWPGKRINRNHGICQDGTTICEDTVEFGLAWGPCDGYVLPEESAVSGPGACRCFANGEWRLSNAVPCIHQADEGYYLFSSRATADGGYQCDPVGGTPPAPRTVSWAADQLTVDCAGTFELCFTLKAGDSDAPSAEDCTLTRYCTEVWYPEPGVPQTLPNIPGWTSDDPVCGTRFVEVGGYSEMTVQGLSVECDPVDDGAGGPMVFARSSYCPPSCAKTPDLPTCRECAVGSSGRF